MSKREIKEEIARLKERDRIRDVQAEKIGKDLEKAKEKIEELLGRIDELDSVYPRRDGTTCLPVRSIIEAMLDYWDLEAKNIVPTYGGVRIVPKGKK